MAMICLASDGASETLYHHLHDALDGVVPYGRGREDAPVMYQLGSKKAAVRQQLRVGSACVGHR